MKLLIRRALFFLLLSGGVAAVVYGARYHAAVVEEKREVEREILIPLAGFAPGTGFGMPGAPGLSDGMPPGNDQGFMKKKITQQVVVEKIVAEASLNREVSFGGVALAADGTLLQTYSGRPPSLCPT